MQLQVTLTGKWILMIYLRTSVQNDTFIAKI